MMKVGNLTGYPSNDKPHLSKYNIKPAADIIEYDNTYDMIFQQKDMQKAAIYYLEGNCVWTMGKLKEKTDYFIKGFKQAGLKEGDNVLYGALATPEFVAAVIALISIGVTLKGFDIRANEHDIVKLIKDSDCKYAIVFDVLLLDKFVNLIDKTNLTSVFVLRPANSMSRAEKIVFLMKAAFMKMKIKKSIALPKDKRFVELTAICRDCSNQTTERARVDYSRPCIKVQSSGTTGKAKTIVHSEQSIVEFAKSIAFFDASIKRDFKPRVFVALPPWIAYGVGNAILNPLIFGASIDLSMDFEPDAVYRNIGRFDMAYAAPFHYRYIRDHYNELSEEKKTELRKVDSLVTGGDKYSAKENEEDEALFGVTIVNGYGNNEGWGCISINPNSDNRYGSVGIPRYGDTVIIYDNEHDCELKYGQIGEICLQSKSVFMYYENNPEATAKTKKIHSDGKCYMHTGDLGYIDEDGYIYVIGRNERVITRLGFKLSAYTIEDAICKMQHIKECIAIEVPDDIEEHVPMVFAVPNKTCQLSTQELVAEITEYCKGHLKENEVPKYIVIEEDSLKVTENNKYDFRYYEKLGKEYIERKSVHS